MRGGATRSYPAFPDIEDEVGYNPARFLDTPDEHPRIGDTSPLATAWALIRGIQDIETIRAWLTVEVELGRGNNGGPRKCVIKRLNRRQLQIEETAETAPSAENTGHASHTGAPATTTDDSEPATHDGETAIEDGDSTTDGEETTTTAPVTASDGQVSATSSTASAATALATDGGTEPSTPRCPDCRGELHREDIAGEVAYWCAPCGGFREPADAATEMEAR